VNPNRISSSGRGRSDWFKLDQLRWPVRSGQHRTAVNCNPNCNPATASLAFWSVDSSAGARTRSDRFRDLRFITSRIVARTGRAVLLAPGLELRQSG
jgi:hypothetical protein